MSVFFDCFPLIMDIVHEYRILRQTNHGRDEAIQIVLENNSAALMDYDDSPQIWIGLAKVTGQKNELTPELLEKALSSFDSLSEVELSIGKAISTAKAQICDPGRIGPEARYSQKRFFQPDWEIGDTFVYQLKTDIAVRENMENWYAVIRKVGEFKTVEMNQAQIVLLSVCKPNEIPTTDEELNNLGYIPTQPYSKDLFEFQWTIDAGSKKALYAYHLQRIGHFPEICRPSCEFINDTSLWPGFPLFPACKSNPYSSLDYYAYNYIRYGKKF